jgi:proteasome assembly chaperone (PAC2) family protein
MLVDRLRAEKAGELYSPYFPDYVISGGSGLCHLPRLEFHASTRVSPNLLILLGEQHANPDDPYAYYDVAETALDYGVLKGCKAFTSCSVFRSQRAEDRIYVAATTSQEASSLAEKLGVKPFRFGRIVSQMGPLLGLAKARGFEAICILGALRGGPYDEGLASLLFDHLVKALGLTLV